jgi:phytanoyl-CoA hydroxylase
MELTEQEAVQFPLDDPARATDSSLPAHVREHLDDMATKGWTVLRTVHDHALIDAAVADYHRFCNERGLARPETRSRIYFIEQESANFKNLLLNYRVIQVLDAAFQAESVLYATQIFERGSQQRIHRDSPFFHTRPFGHYIGVWHALEDVHRDAGPLQYYTGGHLLKAPPVRQWARELAAGSTNQETFDPLLERFDSYALETCHAAGLKPEFAVINKGDVLMWHPWLPHGGSPINDPQRTRLSIVGHYIPRGMPVFNVDVFFGKVDPRTAQRDLAEQTWNGRIIIDQGPAHVPVSYL